MPLLKDGRLAVDPWTAVADDEALPADAPAIVSLERWQASRETLRGHNGRLGIRLKSDQSPGLIAEDLSRFDLVALEFPVFRDGRAFSHARLLRERYGFEGEIRAVGDVLQDQYLFIHRCGFDAVEVADEGALSGWREAMAEISVAYQPATAGRPWVARLRREGRRSPHRDASAGAPAGEDAHAAAE